MRADVFEIVIHDVTYRIEGPLLRGGLQATVTAIIDGQVLASDRINLDRERDRRRFAERAGNAAVAADLLLVRERLLDELAGPPASERDQDERPDPEALAAGLALLDAPRLLDRVTETVAALGWAPPPGGEHLPRLLYLVYTARLLPRPVNAVVDGPSGAGKTHLVQTVARLFPADALVALTGMSERALLYLDADLKHKVLIVNEAAGLHRDGIGAAIMRSVAWEGHVVYPTVEKTRDGQLVSRTLRLEGPTALVTTTTKGLEPELETRLLRVSVPDTLEATRAILAAQAQRANGTEPEPPDLAPWHAAQWWLEHEGVRTVTIPYAERLAALVPAREVRMRRDFPQLLTLIQAHALLHQRQRARDACGRLVATLEDYRAVYTLVAPLYEALASGGVTPAVREAVEVVADLCAGDPERTVSVAELARSLHVDKASASRRATRAIRLGYLVNLETRRGYPARLRPGEPLPERIPALPDSTALESCCTPPQCNSATPGQDDGPDAENPLQPACATPVQQCNDDGGAGCTVAQPLQSANATVFRDGDAETGGPLHCCTPEQRHEFSEVAVLEYVAKRGRAVVWQIGRELGLPDPAVLLVVERLVAAGQVRRVGDDVRAPLSLWSEVARTRSSAA